MNRALHFKIEKLNSNDVVLEEMTPRLVEGDVKITYDDISRRTCNFTLLEPLPDDWMSYRWKLYYGMEVNGVVEYTPQGVFIPVNPEESEVESGYITKYQGIDKAQILHDAQSEIPLTFPAGMTLKTLAQTIFAMINETKLNLEDLPYALATEFTFEEGTSLEHILSILVRSFAADWYYDANGYAVLERLPVADQRPVKYTFTEGDDAIHIDTVKSIDTSKYWNRVTIIGGTADSGIFRQVYSNEAEYARAGRYVSKFFKEDSATSQAQVNELATQLLDIGSRLPANIVIHNLPLPDLEPKDVIMHGNKKYEVITLNVPLDTGLQSIQAGEIL